MDKLTPEQLADVKQRFNKWLNYEPVINDVTEAVIDEYVDDVLTSAYFEYSDEIRIILKDDYGW